MGIFRNIGGGFVRFFLLQETFDHAEMMAHVMSGAMKAVQLVGDLPVLELLDGKQAFILAFFHRLLHLPEQETDGDRQAGGAEQIGEIDVKGEGAVRNILNQRKTEDRRAVEKGEEDDHLQGMLQFLRLDLLQADGELPVHETPDEGKKEQGEKGKYGGGKDGIFAVKGGGGKRDEGKERIGPNVYENGIIQHKAEDQQLFQDGIPKEIKQESDAEQKHGAHEKIGEDGEDARRGNRPARPVGQPDQNGEYGCGGNENGRKQSCQRFPAQKKAFLGKGKQAQQHAGNGLDQKSRKI